ncbi:MAG: long-chain acyl-CoA synthetase [Bryobacterales bacterium]|jgi:acyl-CoA synthetase (AMP-forming)/AMP-acid ligase II|nr:long-chain acyl-CoA synthetase [Bryobacterales bacterium]
MLRPFDQAGIVRDAGGIARYQSLAPSLVEMLRRTVDARPGAEAVVEVDGGRISYRELWDRAARVAGGLRSLGIRRGDRVAIRLGNGIDWCVAFFGIQFCGAAAVPVNTRFSEAEIEYVVDDSGSSFVFLPGAALPDGAPFAIEDLGHQALSAIFYTSGTTGFPKGAMTTHANFLSNMESARRVKLAPSREFRNLVSAPLFHVTGCNTQLLPTCAAGGTTVLLPKFHVQTFLRAIEAERIEVMITVPAIYWLAIHQDNFRTFDLSGVRCLAYGGAAAAPDLIAGIIEAFPNASVSNSYGLTEVSSMATFLPGECSLTRPDSVGLAVPVVDLRLADVPPGGDVGELLIRGPNVVAGYWNKPAATAETFVDGWLRTGDLARLDEQGFLQIVDRKKDMVNRGGENVYCVEVESALTAHPDIFEVAVMGVPDPMMGEKVGAIVVPKPGRSIEVSDVIRFAGNCLADFKVPQYMVVREELLPRNPGGKILKKALRQSVEWGKPVR